MNLELQKQFAHLWRLSISLKSEFFHLQTNALNPFCSPFFADAFLSDSTAMDASFCRALPSQ